MKVEIGCTGGSAKLYSDRETVEAVLTAGHSKVTDVGAPTATTMEKTPGDALADAVVDSWEAPGIGVNGHDPGVVFIRALEGDCVVRQYLQTDAFLNPDAEQYMDIIVTEGREVKTSTVTSNAVTLMVASS